MRVERDDVGGAHGSIRVWPGTIVALDRWLAERIAYTAARVSPPDPWTAAIDHRVSPGFTWYVVGVAAPVDGDANPSINARAQTAAAPATVSLGSATEANMRSSVDEHVFGVKANVHHPVGTTLTACS